MVDKIEIGNRLKKIRQLKSIKQEDIVLSAKELDINISRSQVSKVESGELWPSFDLLSTLILVYKINPEWFLVGDGEIFKNTEESEKTTIKKILPNIDKKYYLIIKEILDEMNDDAFLVTLSDILPVIKDKAAQRRKEKEKIFQLLEGEKIVQIQGKE